MTELILWTCSRSWREWSTTRLVAKTLRSRYPEAVLLHGNAEEGDQQVAGIWKSLGGLNKPCDADWDTCVATCRPGHRRVRRKTGREFCPSAGFRRNVVMVEQGPMLCVATINRDSSGASGCAKLTIDAGIPTLIYRSGSVEPELYNVDAAVGAP